MDIEIKKQDTGEGFDIKPDTSMQIDNRSPLFNDKGSMVVSANLPMSETNKMLLDFSNRMYAVNKAASKLPVIITSGSFQRMGTLAVETSDNKTKLISASMAFDEGVMYEDMSELKLAELSGLPVIKSTVSALMLKFNNLLVLDNPDSDLSIFQICIDTASRIQEAREVDTESGSSTYQDQLFILNEIDFDHPILKKKTKYYTGKDESTDVTLPGFGISPFIKVWKVIELICAHYGYKVGQNPYKTHFQLRKLCVLNNVADCIVTGNVDYKYLMPDCTVRDFFDSLYARQGAVLFFNSNTRVLDILLLKDIFSQTAITSFDQYLASDYIVKHTAGKQLKISHAKGLYNASTSTDSWDEFYTAYKGQIDEAYGAGGFAGIVYATVEGVFWQIPVDYTTRKNFKVISSIHFDWNKKVEDMEYEDITGKDECVTMRILYSGSDNITEIQYSAGARFVNTLYLSANKQEEDSESKCPLCFAFSMGHSTGYNRTTVNWGSIFARHPFASKGENYIDEYGNTWLYDLTITGENGSFNRFFRDYDAFLRHANNELTVDLKLPGEILSDIQFQNMISIDSQLLLLDNVPHQLGKSTTVEIVARTVKLLQPYDLEEEYAEPVSEGIKYKWVLTTNKEAQINNLVRSEMLKYEANPNPDNFVYYRLISFDKQLVVDKIKPPTDLWLLPPGKEDYESGVFAAKGTASVDVYLTGKYEYQLSLGGTMYTETIPVYSMPKDYEYWWIAQEV